MRSILFLTTAVLFLAACSNTWEGLKQDAGRVGDKAHKIAETVTEP